LETLGTRMENDTATLSSQINSISELRHSEQILEFCHHLVQAQLYTSQVCEHKIKFDKSEFVCIKFDVKSLWTVIDISGGMVAENPVGVSASTIQVQQECWLMLSM
jgi:hypothetical protein